MEMQFFILGHIILYPICVAAMSLVWTGKMETYSPQTLVPYFQGCIFIHPIRNHLLGAAFRIRLSDGRCNWITHTWMVCVDDIASSTEVPVFRVQDWIPTGSWTWCISCSVVGLTLRLTPQIPHSLSNFPDETHSDICDLDSPSVPRTRIGMER